MADFGDVFNPYLNQLKQLKAATPPSFDQVVQVLRLRDQVQGAIKDQGTDRAQDIEAIAQISSTDAELKKQLLRLRKVWKGQAQKDYLIRKDKLEQTIDLYTQTPNCWWWRQFRFGISRWDRYDWISNAATVAVSIGATSVFTQTVQLIAAVGGFNFVGAFVTLSQVFLGGLFAGGTLTDKGRKEVGKLLDQTPLRRHLHSEAILAVALVLTGAFLLVREVGVASLERDYRQQAQRYLEAGNFFQSIETYKDLKLINPDLNLAPRLGRLYELNLQLDQAQEEYRKGISRQEVQSLLGLSRVMILQNLLQSESGFLGEISEGETVRMQFYISEATQTLLNSLFAEILELTAQISNRNMSADVEAAIRFINEREQSSTSRQSILEFHETVLALDKIRLETDSQAIDDFLSTLYTSDHQQTQQLIETRINLILLSWAEVDLNDVDLRDTSLDEYTDYQYTPGEFIVQGFEETPPPPPFITEAGLERDVTVYRTESRTDRQTRTDRYQQVLIERYRDLPQWQRLNCYLKIDQYLNRVDTAADGASVNGNDAPVLPTADEQAQVYQASEQAYQCLESLRNGEFNSQLFSAHEAELMFTVFMFADTQAQVYGIISRP